MKVVKYYHSSIRVSGFNNLSQVVGKVDGCTKRVNELGVSDFRQSSPFFQLKGFYAILLYHCKKNLLLYHNNGLLSKIKKQIWADFDGGNINGYAGVIIVKQIDTELELSRLENMILLSDIHALTSLTIYPFAIYFIFTAATTGLI